MKLCVIVPTLVSRKEIYNEFLRKWIKLFRKHNITLITIWDGDNQYLETSNGDKTTPKQLLGKNADLIYSHDTACKNFGLAYALLKTDCTHILILDDDTRPIDDPIINHIDILDSPTPLSWLSTMQPYPRGLPYKTRGEGRVKLSHGVWEGVKDWDAPTQLVMGNRDAYFPKVVIPKGTYFPMCFHPSSLITMADLTTKKIEDVSIGDMVVSGNGKVNKVYRKISRVIDDELLEISFHGGKSFFVTPEHLILTDDGWKKASEITNNQFLLKPKLKTLKPTFSNEDMYMYGLFIAEGSFSKNSNMKDEKKLSGINFSLNTDEEKTIGSKINSYFVNNFNKKPYKYIKGNSLRYDINGKDIANLFFEKCGEYAHNKCISKDLVLRSNIGFLIKGLFDGDGCVSENRGRPSVSYKTISKKLANQINTIIGSLGYFSNLSEYQPKNRTYKQYSINLYGENAEKFAKKILLKKNKWLRKKKKKSKFFKYEKRNVLMKVKSVKKHIFSGRVYDLSVENDPSYLVSGIIVHNCGMNVMVKREAVPYLYFAPPYKGKHEHFNRADDIFAGIVLKREFDKLDWGCATGYSTILHERASNVFDNLVKEALFIKLNETFWEGDESHPYFKEYLSKYRRYKKLLLPLA